MTDNPDDLVPLLRSRLVLARPDRLVAPRPWAGHIPFAFWLVEALRPRLVVELGTHSGNSYCAFLQALAASGLDATAFAVDTWRGDDHAGHYDETVYAELAGYHDPRYGRFSTLLRTTFDEALPRFEDRSIDLLHIDGLHTYEAVQHDFVSWLPKLSERGVVLFHDTAVRRADFEVWRLFEELSSRYPSFAFEHSHGLGVLSVGNAPMPSGLRWLMGTMARGGDTAAIVRRFFARLGEGFADPPAPAPSAIPTPDPLGATLAEPVNAVRRPLRNEITPPEPLREVRIEQEDALADEVAVLAAALRERERQVADLHASSSWRLTAGFRRAAAALRRVGWQKQHLAADLAFQPGARFDAAYYLEQNRDVRAAGIDPWHHFVTTGAASGLRPNAVFDPAWYLAEYADARRSGRNPLVHYIIAGAAAGHDAGPDFSPSGYFAHYPELAPTGMEPLDHYLQFGRAEGRVAMRRGSAVPGSGPPLDPFAAWLAVNRLSPADVVDLRAALADRGGKVPRISLLTPVHETEPSAFAEMIDSVLAQVHEDWELCLVDDGSTSRHVAPMLAAAAARDPRIRVGRLEEGRGASAATNAALAMANGAVVAFLDPDDRITPDCVAELALYYADHPEADLVYSDDDTIDPDGGKHSPRFKPDWSPVLLLANMYLGHIVSARRSLVIGVGGLRTAFDGSQDHDLVLRIAEQARHVGHVPKILYHQRAAPPPAVAIPAAGPWHVDVTRRVVEDALRRRGLPQVGVVNQAWATARGIAALALEFPDDGPHVTIVIPTRNKLHLLRGCIESLSATTYRNHDVLVVDNDSDDPEALAYLASLRDRPSFRVVRVPSRSGRFNFAALNNEAVAEHCTADYILFLNNDTAVIDPAWLSTMMGYATLPNVGTVGARLLYADGTVQHVGTIAGFRDGIVAHAFRNVGPDDPGYMGLVRTTHECSAVTGACLLVERQLFERLGGFDAENFAVAYNDIAFGYRVLGEGLLNVYCATATLTHFESQTRGISDDPKELAEFRRLYEDFRDPWYNRNLGFDPPYQPRALRAETRRSGGIALAVVTAGLAGDEAAALCDLVLGLVARGDFRAMLLAGTDGPLREAYEAAGVCVRIDAHPVERDASKEAIAAAIADTAQRLRDTGADVVLVDGLSLFWAVAGAERAGLGAVWRQSSGENWQSLFNRLLAEVGPIACRAHVSAYQLFYGTLSMCQNGLRLARHNADVARPALPLGPFREAIAARSREGERTQLGIADDEVLVVVVGPLRSGVRQPEIAAAYGLLADYAQKRTRIVFLDQGAEAGADRLAHLAAADIALCSEPVEVAWRGLAEAMVAGLPLLAALWPSTPEVVRQNANALLYPPGDAAALARRLALLVADPGWRRALGSKSLAVLESRPSFARMVDIYARRLREAVNLAVGEDGPSRGG